MWIAYCLNGDLKGLIETSKAKVEAHLRRSWEEFLLGVESSAELSRGLWGLCESPFHVLFVLIGRWLFAFKQTHLVSCWSFAGERRVIITSL